MKNVLELLITGGKKLKSVSPDLIDKIYLFENMNDFTKKVDLE